MDIVNLDTIRPDRIPGRRFLLVGIARLRSPERSGMMSERGNIHDYVGKLFIVETHGEHNWGGRHLKAVGWPCTNGTEGIGWEMVVEFPKVEQQVE